MFGTLSTLRSSVILTMLTAEQSDRARIHRYSERAQYWAFVLVFSTYMLSQLAHVPTFKTMRRKVL